MKVKLSMDENITKEYSLPRELGALCSDCWNAGHDGVGLDEVKLIEQEKQAEAQ